MAEFEYERQINGLLEVVKSFLPKENIKTIFDIGIRDSMESIALAENYPNADVYSFECNPATLARCEENIKNSEVSDRIHLIKKAVANKSSNINFFPLNADETETEWKNRNPGPSSLLTARGRYEIEKYIQNKITIEATTIDTFAKEKAINEIDMIWMDVQGAEVLVLSGGEMSLSNVKFIHTETEFFEIYKDQSQLKDIYQYLRKRNFYLHASTNVGPYTGNMIFVNGNILPLKWSASLKSVYVLFSAYTLSFLRRSRYNIMNKFKKS